MSHRLYLSMLSRGYVLILTLVFLGIFFAAGAAYLNFITSAAQSARYRVESAQALAIAEAGIDEAVYQLNNSEGYTGETNTVLGNGVFTVVVSNTSTNTDRLTVTGYVPNATNPVAIKTVAVLVGLDTSVVSFHYGVQIGAGGVTMGNGSQINGNLFSNGSISGSGTGSGGVITGDATIASGTPATSINGIIVNGTAWAHTLSNCTVGKNAFYQNISGCTVGGTQYPGSADAAPANMPISNAQISAWESTAADGGVIAGPYTVNSSQTLGPQEINGNLTVKGTLALSGVVWVRGNINFGTNSSLTVSPATGNQGAIIIADVPGSEASSGTVVLSNNVSVSGNGSAGSYPMVLSTNSGSTAITVSNNAQSVILYASRGTVLVNNNAGANQITAYALTLSPNSTVTYVSGLQNQSFSSGPGGSWAILPHTYSISR
ncbi:MAG: hypothetical protein KGI71_01055 [Patescibacteria group bacterium]|nr:hypothetical protein [Patescibacteria group bacterium]